MDEQRRDERLGAALRGLDLPPHRPDFFDDLALRLKSEQQLSGRRSVAFQPSRVRRATLVAAAAFVAILVVGVVLPPSQSPGPLAPRMATAAEVRSRVADAFAQLQTLRGRITVTCTVPTASCSPPEAGGRATMAWSFVTDAAGSERVTGIGRLDDLAYQADKGRQRTVTDMFGTRMAEEIRGLPPGPPDFAARPSVLRRDVAAAVRAFLGTTSDVPVREVKVGGRPAWRLAADVIPNKLAGPNGSGDRLTVVVDRETGFPLRITETLRGRLLTQVRLSDLVIDEPVGARRFTLRLPDDIEVFRQDVGFRRIRLTQAQRVVGYRPVLPRSVPDGFEIEQVAVARNALPTGNEAANPPSRDVVSVAYRRGFDRIVVTTRSRGPYGLADPTGVGAESGWADPLATGEGFVDVPTRFRVASGALAGARAALLVTPRAVPHVWALDDDLVVTVAGDVAAADLRRMIESFAPGS